MSPSTANQMTSTLPQDVTPISAGSRSETLGEMILDAAARFEGVALQHRRDGQTVRISYSALGAISTEIAQGLISLGIDPGDRVAILGATSADWTLADCGSLCAGAVVTPIYHTNSPEECAYVLDHSQSRLVFCEDAAQLAKIEQVRDRCPMLEHVVTFKPAGDAITLDELRRRGGDIPPERVYERVASAQSGDIATLVYTSGTTGPPKGCMLSHENFIATVRMYEQRLGLDRTHSMYQFLPLAHVLARVAQAVVLSVGGAPHLLGRRHRQDRRRAGGHGSYPRARRAADLREDAGRRHRRDRTQAGSAARAVRVGHAVRRSRPASPA